MKNVCILEHPLVQHKMAHLRKSDTGAKEFRELAKELASLLTYEATRDLPLAPAQIETPMGPADVQVLAGKKLAVVPILRAGLGMVDGVLRLVPAAKVGHIGLYRDPATLRPVDYYCKLPQDIAERTVFILDPMLATGGSAVEAARVVKAAGCKSLRFLCLVAAPEGIQALQAAHPDVPIFAASLDAGLNDHGYILPGLGDAGDRLFGTL